MAKLLQNELLGIRNSDLSFNVFSKDFVVNYSSDMIVDKDFSVLKDSEFFGLADLLFVTTSVFCSDNSTFHKLRYCKLSMEYLFVSKNGKFVVNHVDFSAAGINDRQAIENLIAPASKLILQIAQEKRTQR